MLTGADQDGIIARWRELVSDPAIVSSAWMRENLVGIALYFAELAGRFLVWERALEGMNMGESQLAARWEAKGEVRATRALLLDLLRTKYPGSVSAEVEQMVERQTDLALLNHWFQSALQKATFEDFVQTLK